MPAIFFPREEQVVWPFDFRLRGRCARPIARRKAVAEAMVSWVVSCGTQARAQQHRKPQAFAAGGNPLAPQTSPAASLRFRKDHHAFLDAIASQFFNDIVGGSGFLEYPDIAANDTSLPKPREQVIRVQASGTEDSR